MESIISKISNFIEDNIYDYDYDSDDESVIDPSDSNFFGFFKRDLYENFGKKKKNKKKVKAKKEKKKAAAEGRRNKISDSINPSEEGKYNKSKLIRFTKKNPADKTPLDVNIPNSLNHKFAITPYGAAVLDSVTKKYYNYTGNTKAFYWKSVNDSFSTLEEARPPEFIDYNLVKLARDRGNDLDNINNQPNRYIKKTTNKRWNDVNHTDYKSYLVDGGSYQLDSKPVDGDNDGYKWIEARSSDNPPRLRYYKIMLFAADKENPELDPGNNKSNSYMTGGYFWYHNATSSQLALDFNYHGLHISPTRITDVNFWNVAGRVAAETWFPPIVNQSPTEASSGSGFNMTKFLNDYAFQQASYPDKDMDEGVDTPDLFSNALAWTLISPDDIDAAMMAKDDADFDAELAAEALAAKQKEMLGALGQAFPADPLERLKSMFLYDNLLTLHLGKYHKGAGKGGRIINPHITQDTSKPSFYKTITKVTPDHDKVMTNFIEDVKDRTIYICSNVILGISICFLPYIKFPVLDALVHSLVYTSNSNQQTFNISRMPLTAKFTALFLSLQTSLITSLKTNAAPLCAVIGLGIITMTLPTIHYKPGKIEMDGIRTSWEGLATLNYFYMLIALFPPMAPNITLEESLYSMFFPPGGEFDKVLERIIPLIFMMILQSTFATDFLILNIWFICMVPAVCLLIFPLFRTFARYLGGDMGNQAATMIDKISSQLVEDNVNEKDSDTGLSMMDLVTKVILVLAVFFIFAEFFDAVNDHFGLSNLIIQMVNSFRTITTIIPEILLVFFIVMTFSKAIKSVGMFNEEASATAKWDNETKQELKNGKNPAYAMLEYFIGAFKDVALLSVGTITGKQDAFTADKNKQIKDLETARDTEQEAIKAEAKKQSATLREDTERKKIYAKKQEAKDALDALLQIELDKIKADEKATADKAAEAKEAAINKLKELKEKQGMAKKRQVFLERQQKTRQEYELKRLEQAAKNDKEIGERQIEMAMILGSGGKMDISPIQIKQMMTADSSFKSKMENAIKSGQDVTKIIQDQVDKSKASAAGFLSAEQRQEQQERQQERDEKLVKQMEKQLETAEEVIKQNKEMKDDFDRKEREEKLGVSLPDIGNTPDTAEPKED